eukprot:SAG31_NODE_33501_length_343_cov_0.639344_2_plen_45_part_01
MFQEAGFNVRVMQYRDCFMLGAVLSALNPIPLLQTFKLLGVEEKL